MNKIKCIEQPLRFSRNLRTFRMYRRLDIFNHWFHAAMRLFSTVVDHRLTWRMVKSENRRDAEILVRNPGPRLFGEEF